MTAPTRGPYRLLGQLGEGGMGIVYRAEHVKSGQPAAVKTIRLRQRADLAGIRTEIHTLSTIRHPGVVRILDQGVADGVPWYAMELLEGRTLRDLHDELWDHRTLPAIEGASQESVETVTSLQPLPSGGATGATGGRPAQGAAAGGRLIDALTLVRRLCEPLGEIHAHGLVHRDLKPSNVFIRSDGTPVLMDFGLAARFHAGGREVIDFAATASGTALYMAPEQIELRRVDARADLYALGVLLYELIAGHPPFAGSSVAALLTQQLSAMPVAPSFWVQGVPRELDELTLRLLAKSPRDRLGYAEDVATALGELGAQNGWPHDADGHRRRVSYLYRPELSGREAMIATLREHFARVVGGRGGCLLIGGESGVGKTTLVTEAARHAVVLDLVVITGEAVPVQAAETGVSTTFTNAPFHLFRPWLQSLADRCLTDGPATTRRLLGARGKVLAEIEPGLASLPGLDEFPDPAPLSPEAARNRLFRDLGASLAAFASDGPVLLILDDLQWADELSVQFVVSLLGGDLRQQPVFILGTYRSDEVSESLGELLDHPGVQRLDLGRLDDGTIGVMVGEMLALDVPPANFVRFLARHSEGNPFFVAEYLRTAVAEQLLFRESGRWTLRAAATDASAYDRLPVPGSLRELVGRRLAGLPDPARVLAEVAAVVGREFDLDFLSVLAGTDDVRTMDALKELLARHVFEETAAGRLRFAHDKLRETAYDGIALDQRRSLHRSVAMVIETRRGAAAEVAPVYAELAHHFRQADEPVKAMAYLEKAADQAMKHFANREAVKFLEDMLALNEQTGSAATLTRRARWKADLGKAYRALGQTTQARRHLEGALEDLDHVVPRGGARLGLQMAWHIARALAPTRRSMAGYLTDVDPKAVTAVDAYNQLALLMHYINEYASQIFCVFAGLKDAPRAGPTPEVAQLYGTAANVFAFMGLHSTARRYAALTHAVAEATGQPLTVGIAHQYTGHLAACLGELSWFDRDMHRALAIYDECCHPRLWEEALTNCAYLYAFQGDLERSHAAFLRLERSGRSRDDLQTTAWGLLGQGRVLLARGQFEQALARLNQAEPLVRDNISRCELYGNRALAYLRAGSTEHAKAEALRARDLLGAAPSATYTNLGAYASTTEVLLSLWEHRGDATRRELGQAGQQMCRLLRRFGRTIPLARPQSMLWSGVYAWRLGWSAVAQRRWRQALMTARRIGLPADEAAAHYWLGAGHSGPTGRDHLARAAALYERLGYAFEAARARRAAG